MFVVGIAEVQRVVRSAEHGRRQVLSLFLVSGRTRICVVVNEDIVGGSRVRVDRGKSRTCIKLNGHRARRTTSIGRGVARECKGRAGPEAIACIEIARAGKDAGAA